MVLAGDIGLSSWTRHFTLEVPLSDQVSKWVLVKLGSQCVCVCVGGGGPCYRLAYHTGGEKYFRSLSAAVERLHT